VLPGGERAHTAVIAVVHEAAAQQANGRGSSSRQSEVSLSRSGRAVRVAASH
jgi:hypothetical protein